jgi:glucosyl-3-phosphoglycerate phosphatase
VTPAVARLLLWRHGQTEWNVTGRFQGQTDIGLDEAGRAQVEQCAGRLAARQPDAIVSSDLRRCADSAAALSALTGRAVSYDRRLRERAYGEWEGHTRLEVEARWPAALARWHAGLPVEDAGVEEPDDVAKRMHEVLRDVATRYAGATVVVAGHGGAIRAGIGALLGWAPATLRTLGNLGNCHWSELRNHPRRGWQLGAHNVG